MLALAGGSVAKRTDPKLWERAKDEACKKSEKLCPHSARKMQWAVNWYKKQGGGYEGEKRSDNSLAKWTREKWTTRDGRDSDGKRRYLPEAAWDMLSEAEKQRADRTKREGESQWVPNPEAAREAARRARNEAA